MPTTTNYGWTTPTPGGSSGSWGSLINAAFVKVDADLDAVQATADAALPKAGGEMSGRVDLQSSTTKVVALGNITGATALDITEATGGQYFTGTLTGAVTFSIGGTVPSAGVAFAIILKLTNSEAGVTWPGGTKWNSGVDPEGTADTDVYVLLTDDGGATWNGVQVMRGQA